MARYECLEESFAEWLEENPGKTWDEYLEYLQELEDNIEEEMEIRRWEARRQESDYHNYYDTRSER